MPIARRMIKKALAVHRWAGLISGLLLLLVTLSGALLLFKHELNPVLYPGRYHVAAPAGGAASLDTIYQAVRKAYPGVHLTGLEIPHRPGQVVTVSFSDSAADGEAARHVSVNPYTGTVFDLRKMGSDFRGNFFVWLLQFHQSLLVRPLGEVAVGLLALSFLLSIATGFFVYRNHIGKVLRFRVPIRRRGGRVAASSLHRVVGVWALLFNTMVALTALWMVRNVFTPAFFTRAEAPAGRPAPAPPFDFTLSLDSLVTEARLRYPAFQPRMINLPAREKRPLILTGEVAGDFFLYPANASTLTFSPEESTFTNASFFRNRSRRYKLDAFIAQLHFGQYGGLFVKGLYLLGGLTPALLSITGFMLWLGRNRSRRRPTPRAAGTSSKPDRRPGA